VTLTVLINPLFTSFALTAQCFAFSSAVTLPHHADEAFLVAALVAAAAEIVTALLNLAEFMEHDDKRLPLDTRTLGALAEKCHAFAKVGCRNLLSQVK
jgi:hypothetical protein